MNKRGYFLKKFWIVGIIFLFLLSCAGSKKETRGDTSSGTAVNMDESFDPLSLDDEDIEFKEETPSHRTYTKPIENLEVKETLEEELEVENVLVDGFRIQLLSTKNLENATRAKTIAAEKFSDMQVKFYLDFDSPYYKVRVGDFRTREEADNVREMVRKSPTLTL